jgi:hypothetical protein
VLFCNAIPARVFAGTWRRGRSAFREGGSNRFADRKKNSRGRLRFASHKPICAELRESGEAIGERPRTACTAGTGRRRSGAMHPAMPPDRPRRCTGSFPPTAGAADPRRDLPTFAAHEAEKKR